MKNHEIDLNPEQVLNMKTMKTWACFDQDRSESRAGIKYENHENLGVRAISRSNHIH